MIIRRIDGTILTDQYDSVVAAVKAGVSLRQADLSYANLSDADLSDADLTGAYLFRANLSGAKLFRANLAGAKLTEAKLSDTDLTGAKLTGVWITIGNRRARARHGSLERRSDRSTAGPTGGEDGRVRGAGAVPGGRGL